MTDQTLQGDDVAETMTKLDAAWERRKARLLRSLQGSPLDRWLRGRR